MGKQFCVFAHRHRPRDNRAMDGENPRSQFVRLVMPDASEAEIEEAVRRWFGFLRTVDRIVARHEREACDSQESDGDGTIGKIPHIV